MRRIPRERFFPAQSRPEEIVAILRKGRNRTFEGGLTSAPEAHVDPTRAITLIFSAMCLREFAVTGMSRINVAASEAET
jgi:hypothetical protein